MRKSATHLLAAVGILGFVMNSTPAQSASLVAEGATVEKLAGNFRFTEGPAPDAKGNIYFTDLFPGHGRQGNTITNRKETL